VTDLHTCKHCKTVLSNRFDLVGRIHISHGNRGPQWGWGWGRGVYPPQDHGSRLPPTSESSTKWRSGSVTPGKFLENDMRFGSFLRCQIPILWNLICYFGKWKICYLVQSFSPQFLLFGSTFLLPKFLNVILERLDLVCFSSVIWIILCDNQTC
jgi:hypothetical protein